MNIGTTGVPNNTVSIKALANETKIASQIIRIFKATTLNVENINLFERSAELFHFSVILSTVQVLK
jgi:hypothetical protein